MPVVTFWMLHKNIDRISAERDQRQALILIQCQSSEGVKALMTDLRKQMGQTIVIDEAAQRKQESTIKPDREALRRIAAIGDLTNRVYPR